MAILKTIQTRSTMMFKRPHEHRVLDCGHNLPWEAPNDFAGAILTVRKWTAEA
jgi:pimeloyl-ACP methyl ester carboxylesterase